MAKVTGPLMSIDASGAFADTMVYANFQIDGKTWSLLLMKRTKGFMVAIKDYTLTDNLHDLGLFSHPFNQILKIFHRWAAPFHHPLPVTLSTVNLSSPS